MNSLQILSLVSLLFLLSSCSKQNLAPNEPDTVRTSITSSASSKVSISTSEQKLQLFRSKRSAALEEQFKRLDADGDGKIEPEEREHFFETKYDKLDINDDHKLTDSEVQGILPDDRSKFDQDHDGDIDESEYLKEQEKRSDEFDTDGDDSITLNEFLDNAAGQ